MALSTLSRWSRRIALLATLSMLLGLAAPATAARAGAERAEDEVEGIDLAWTVPGISDLEALDLGDLVPNSVSGYGDLDTFLAPWSFAEGDRDRFVDGFTDAGFVQAYRIWWANGDAVAAALDGGAWDPVTQVSFMALQFADDAGAEDGFTTLLETVTVADDEAGLGDDAVLGDHVYVGEQYAADGVELVIRADDLVLHVLVRTQVTSDLHGDEEAIARDMAEVWLERIDAGAPADGLGLRTPRYAADGLTTSMDAYILRDGQQAWAYDPGDSGSGDAIIGQFLDLGAIAVYDLTQTLPVTGQDGDTLRYRVETRTVEYASDDMAADVIAGLADNAQGTGWDVTGIETLDGPGDGGITFDAVSADESRWRSDIAWHDGSTAYLLRVVLPERPADPDALAALAEIQVECSAARDCWRSRPLPDEILSDAAALGDGGATPTAGSTPADEGLASLADDEHDFMVTFDTATWEIDVDSLAGGEGGTRLDHRDGGTLYLVPVEGRSARDVETCLEDTSETLLGEGGVDDVEPLEDEDGDPIEGVDDTFAYAGYTLTFEGDERFDWFGCAALDDGDTALAFVFVGLDPEDAEAQISDVWDIVDSLERL